MNAIYIEWDISTSSRGNWYQQYTNLRPQKYYKIHVESILIDNWTNIDFTTHWYNSYQSYQYVIAEGLIKKYMPFFQLQLVNILSWECHTIWQTIVMFG